MRTTKNVGTTNMYNRRHPNANALGCHEIIIIYKYFGLFSEWYKYVPQKNVGYTNMYHKKVHNETNNYQILANSEWYICVP